MKNRILSLLHSTHLKFGVIAAALVALSLFVGLSAYLTTSSNDYNPMFRTANGEEFGLSITGQYYEAPDPDDENYTPDTTKVTPGQVLTLNPTVYNSGTESIYVFAKVSIGSLMMGSYNDKGQIINGIASDWHRLNDESDIYYLGTQGAVTPLAKKTPSTIFKDVTVPIATGTNANFYPSVIAYAIQTEIDTDDPETVWGYIQTQSTSGGDGE